VSPVDPQWVVLDLGRNREYGGLSIAWDGERYAKAYRVEVSVDRATWTTVHETATGHGRVDYLYTPDAESRYIRIALPAGGNDVGYGIRDVAIKPVEFSASPNRFFEAIARDAPPGTYPKYLAGKQTYWTVIGVNGDGHTAIMNEEGAIEPDRGGFTIEPFLHTGDRLVTREHVRLSQRLEDDYLPIPSVVWETATLRMTITAFATGTPGASWLVARYAVKNLTQANQAVDLFLTFRPFQVTPPWQSLNLQGGVTTVRDLGFAGNTAWVDRRRVVALVPPDHVGAATFEEGSVTEFLLANRVPPRAKVSDPTGFASGVLQYHLYLDPNGQAVYDLAVPLHDEGVASEAPANVAWVTDRLARARNAWRTALNRVEWNLPPDAKPVVDTLRSSLAWALIDREGPALRPGPRNYARTWIRDGAVTSSALLQLGFPQEVREFLRWYAQYQQPDGKIPCCIDRRGADPVSEHDSVGAFVWTVAEYYRHTRDVGFLTEMWPTVVRAVDYMAALRASRMSADFRSAEKEAYYGLLPESISHEGYSAHPVHSYWDDFFALRGLEDATDLAVVVGDDEHAAAYAQLRDDFRTTLYASIARTMVAKNIDYIPGSVELGDFDPTSTSIAIEPGGELGQLPAPALQRTFDRYWDEVQGRLAGTRAWENYTPYEIRNVGTFVRLGRKDRAEALLAGLMADRRPPAWNGWAEIVWRDRDAPQFVGDMPHGWVAAGFIRAIRAFFADERDLDGALVVGQGVPAAWVTSGGLNVKRLPTHYGVLNLTMTPEGPDAIRVRLSGDLTPPRGGLVVHTPLARPLRAVTVNDEPVATFAANHVRVTTWPATVVLTHEPEGVETVPASDPAPDGPPPADGVPTTGAAAPGGSGAGAPAAPLPDAAAPGVGAPSPAFAEPAPAAAAEPPVAAEAAPRAGTEASGPAPDAPPAEPLAPADAAPAPAP
jgi:hypothetical protein